MVGYRTTGADQRDQFFDVRRCSNGNTGAPGLTRLVIPSTAEDVEQAMELLSSVATEVLTTPSGAEQVECNVM